MLSDGTSYYTSTLMSLSKGISHNVCAVDAYIHSLLRLGHRLILLTAGYGAHVYLYVGWRRVCSEKEQEMDVLPSSPRSESTPAVVGAPATTPGEPRPPFPPSRSLSSSAAAADCGPGGGSLPRLVAARRAVETQHQPAESQSAGSSLVVNGDCSAPGCSATSSPTSTAAPVPPTYGVDSDDVDALRHVRTHLITHR